MNKIVLPDIRKFSNKKLFQLEKSDFKRLIASHQESGKSKVLEKMKDELRPATVQIVASAAKMILTEWNVNCSNISSLIWLHFLLRAENITRVQ